MNKNRQWINPELVELVALATKAIAEAKGYLTYPKEAEVRLVLQGLYIVNQAIKAKENRDGIGRGRKDKSIDKSKGTTSS